jgi:hypothetical protein
MTFETSQQSDLFPMELESMSLLEGSPAKTYPSQDDNLASTESVVDCGPNVPVYLGNFDLNTPSLKTSQTCLTESGEIGLSEFSGTFPRSGMMRNGTVYQLPRLAPTITEIGSRLWPTPRAQEAKHGAPTDWEMTTDHAGTRDSLRVQVNKRAFWRTPAPTNGQQGPKSKELYEQCLKTGQSAITLVDEVRHTPAYWPTPASRDYKGARRPETMAKTGRNPETNSLPDSVEFKGQSERLNPTWVEWLMGFPLDHTDLNA